jgi:hypothetical protein
MKMNGSKTTGLHGRGVARCEPWVDLESVHSVRRRSEQSPMGDHSCLRQRHVHSTIVHLHYPIPHRPNRSESGQATLAPEKEKLPLLSPTAMEKPPLSPSTPSCASPSARAA